MLNDAFEALKKYDWGTDKGLVAEIDSAVTSTHGKAADRKDLEDRLNAALKSDISRDAKDYVCRKLAIVGTAASVPTLAGLLADEKHSHMAHFALERIPSSEAAQALRDALPKLSGKLKIGALGSIGARRDPSAVPALSELLKHYDASITRAAAIALGDIGTAEAGKALQAAKPSAAEARQAVIDAQLICAEALLADSKQVEALAIYKSLAGDEQPRLVRLAATRGMLACGAKNV